MKMHIYRTIPAMLLAFGLSLAPIQAETTSTKPMDGKDGMKDTAGTMRDGNGGMKDTSGTMREGDGGMMDTSGMMRDGDGGMAWQKTEATGTITALDPAKKSVTIRGPEGEMTLKTGDQVDLSNLAVGDRVTATYFQAVAVEVREPTQQEMNQPLAVLDRRMRAGDGAGNVEQIRAIVEVTKLDKSKQVATIRGPEGNEFPVHVQDKAAFDKLKKGEKAVVTYTQATVVSLQKQ